jgi:hypothetical protein
MAYSYSKSIINSSSQLGDFLSLGGVTLNGIADSGFGDAQTGALASRRRGLAVYEPLESV